MKMSESTRLTKELIRDRAVADPVGTYERAGMPVGAMRRSGGALKACCPFHDDGDPSLVVFTDGRWKCFGCGKHGDVLDFYMLVHGNRQFGQACDELGNLLAVASPVRPPAQPRPPEQGECRGAIPWGVVGALHERLMADARRLEWLMGRKGLTVEIIRSASIGLGTGPTFRGEMRYTIPVMAVHDLSQIVDIRGYRPHGRPKMLSWECGRGGVKIYPWPWVCDEPEIVWCEGEIDCLNLVARGIPAVTATNGVDGALSVPLPDVSGKSFLVIGDDDSAGRRMNQELPKRLLTAGAKACRAIQWREVMGNVERHRA